ncbi:hypothetical protein [Acidovorax sp. BLS4]|uniref:hypothetical protein n=1 Tax=Acidovorax sp. BLS4 TaxID=3273430 RepID=UPI002941E07F|nr:hypothetical protein [Paracidovorax avenae]WOI43456.1 hypothetical protein R1Z03_12945 [Paracidovorax avenae]
MGARSQITRKTASQQFPDSTNGYFFCLNFGFPTLLTSNATTTTTMTKNAYWPRNWKAPQASTANTMQSSRNRRLFITHS